MVPALSALLAAGCQVKLPEEGTPAAELYRTRCSACHRLYAPSVLKPAMWEIVVERMRGQIGKAHMPALTEEERQTILDYLKRNGG
ncbi:MAG: hypothetical protein QOD06_2858 [Candidatus Binatota bacterium]|nr:hypothetical protein [Candidatus Binatota bacterium]